MFNLDEDGITHINIYSKARTPLGRWLSNFTREPFRIDGRTFQSIEGYWYWLGVYDDRLCPLVGAEAKRMGRKIRERGFSVLPNFQSKIEEALLLKAANRPDMVAKLKATKLPLVHYYVMRGKVHEPKENKWVIEFWERLRSS